MRNIFLENSYTKCGGEASPRLFYKNQSSGFIACRSRGLPEYIKTKVLTTCFCLTKSFFKKQKWSGTSLPTLFSA